MTDDGGFRVIVANTTHTCREICQRQKATGDTARLLSELVTGAVLLRETLAPWLRTQAIAVGAERKGKLIADAYPDGSNRGLKQLSDTENFHLGEGAVMQVMREAANGSTHEGVVEITSAGGINGALMNYMLQSEQIDCVIAVSGRINDAGIGQAGGYIVQVLPEVTRELHMIMTERLGAFPNFSDILQDSEPWMMPLLGDILYGMPFTLLEQSPLRFKCRCSQARVLASLATLDRDTLRDLISVNDFLEIECDYCGENYQIFAEKLKSLLSEN